MGKKYLWDEIPWLSMIHHGGQPRAVACSGHGWLMSIAYTPGDMSTATPEQRLRFAARFCGALQSLGGGKWIWVEERRDPLPGVIIAEPQNRAARLYAKDRMAVHGDGVHYVSRHYLSVKHSPPVGMALRIRNACLLPEPGETEGDYGPVFDEFVRSVDKTAGLLRFLQARVLEGDELASYLRSTISVKINPISVDPHEFLTPQLVDCPLYGGRQLWLGHEHNRLNVRVVQINSYPRRLEAGALDFGDDVMEGLSELGYRIRRIKRIRTQNKSESVRELEWLVKKAAMTQESMLLNVMRQFKDDIKSPLTNKVATVTLDEADNMLDELHRGGVLRCHTTDNILVYHENAATAKKQAENIEEFLEGRGFGVEINDMTTHDCFLGAVPGKTDVDFVRPSVNLLAASVGAPLTKSWSGDLDSSLNPVLAYGSTGSSNRFGLSFHIHGRNRHGFICGGTGGGKSSLLNSTGIGHIIAVEGGRVIRVESGRSGYVASRLVGGVTFNLGEQGCGVQPYRMIDRPNDRSWAHSWTMARIRSQLGEKADDPEITQAVETALRTMATMPHDERTVTTFVLTVPSEEAARAMRLYSNDGTLGYIFDAVDGRSYDADWINFELSAITEDDEALAAPALIAYLWRHIMRLSSPKRPVLLQLDEASAYVEGGFMRGLEKGLRTYRKLRTQVVFATQSVLDLAKSDISHIILNSCPTQIYVQDSAVKTSQGLKVLDELRLSEHDADTIANMDQASQYFVHRPGAGKAVVTFDLGSPISAAMALMTDDHHYQQARKVDRLGDDFLVDWMAHNGIDVEDILGEDSSHHRMAIAAE